MSQELSLMEKLLKAKEAFYSGKGTKEAYQSARDDLMDFLAKQ